MVITTEKTIGDVRPGDSIAPTQDFPGPFLTVMDVQVIGPLRILDFDDETSSPPIPANQRIWIATNND